MVGARARKWYDEEAKKRQVAGQKSGGRGNKKNLVANLPPSNTDTGKARDDAGKAVGVSGKSIDYATTVITKAVPEVVKAVDEGRMSVSTAAILASEPEEKQRQELRCSRPRLSVIQSGRPREVWRTACSGAGHPRHHRPSRRPAS